MRRVPIVRIVRRELKIPAQLAGVGVESDERAGVKIVAGANVAIPVGAGIPDAPVHKLEFRIVRAGDPSRAAAGSPGIARPAFVTSLAGAGNGPEAPGLRAGFRVVGVNESANAGFAAADADDNFSVNSQRGHGHAVAGFVVEHFGRPALDAAL